MSPEAHPRPGVRATEPYVSPQLDVAARLNTNECPYPLPDGFGRDLARAVEELPLNRYPDGQMVRLREELAAYHGHVVEGTWAANGSNEMIAQLLLAYGGADRRVAVFEPTYPLHERIAKLTDAGVIRLPLDGSFGIGRAEVDSCVAERPDVIFVCSPNNPTGNAQPVEMTAELADRTDALVIVDEAYIGFGGESALKLTVDRQNVAVVRTFSKSFALAGARLGYALTSAAVVDDLHRVRLPYHLSSLTQTAGIVALRHVDASAPFLAAIRRQRDRILEELCVLPDMVAYPSDANFVLFAPPLPARDVWRRLLDRGVLVRDLSDVVPNGLRVTAGDEREVDRFLSSLHEVLA